MNRRSLVKLGAGSAAAVAAAATGVPLARDLTGQKPKLLTFSGRVGLPQRPLPSYATQIVEGTVDLGAGSGTVTSRVVAGHPGGTSHIGLPGLGRIMRITRVNVNGSRIRLGGVIEDRSELRRGESPNVEIVVDKGNGTLQAPFIGRQIALPLD